MEIASEDVGVDVRGLHTEASRDAAETATHGRLVEAGLTVFGSRSPRSVRVSDICVAAGLSEQTFYTHFGSIDAFFDAVLERTMADIEAELLPVLSTVPVNGMAAVRSAVGLLAADPRRIRVLFIDTIEKGGQCAIRAHDFNLRWARYVLTWLQGEPTAAQSRSANAVMAATGFCGAAAELLTAWANGFLDMGLADLADAIEYLYERFVAPESEQPDGTSGLR